MAIDSQRAPRAQLTASDDTWLGPVLVAHGVLTPGQEERLRTREGRSLWAAAVGDGASDEAIVGAVSRAYRVAAADLGTAESRTTTLLPEALARKHQVVLIDAGAMPEALVAAAGNAGMYTLWESGLERVWDGTTSLEEVIRVLGERAHDDGATEIAAPQQRGGPVGLPAAPTAAVPAAPAEAAPGTPRVLIADDDPQMRRLIRSVLQREGFDVVEAVDGLDALELAEKGGVDLVILDLDMPRLNGLGVLEELRAQVRTACFPVIILTAQHGETEEKALDLGADDYLSKPVQTRSLVARVRAVLKRVSS
jgi:CheY-like chemotaxis protein